MGKIKVIFKFSGSKNKRIELDVDTERTVEKMILDYLEKIRRVNDMGRFRFLHRGSVLEKLETLQKKVREARITNMAQITVREMDAAPGGINLKRKIKY